MFDRFGRLGLCTILVLAQWLTGCAALRPAQDLPASNASVDRFLLHGRVAVKLDERGYAAGLRWRHSPTGDSVTLLSPLGSVVAEIETDGEGAKLTTADNKIHRANDVQSLTREVLGWDLPLSGLRYWVIGRADPALPVQSQDRDDARRPTSLTQSEWTVTYLAYFGASAMPARMLLVHDRLKLRLIVDRWELPK